MHVLRNMIVRPESQQFIICYPCVCEFGWLGLSGLAWLLAVPCKKCGPAEERLFLTYAFLNVCGSSVTVRGAAAAVAAIRDPRHALGEVRAE